MTEPKLKPAPPGGPTLCGVCAWRADCKKKFSFEQSGSSNCPEFTRDAKLPKDPEAPK